MLLCLYSAGRWGEGRRLDPRGRDHRRLPDDRHGGRPVRGLAGRLPARRGRRRRRADPARPRDPQPLPPQPGAAREDRPPAARARRAGRAGGARRAHPDRGRAARRRRARDERDGRAGRRPPGGWRSAIPTAPATAFSAVETTGREALTEIRLLLGVLRREDEEIALAPQPSLRHLAALVQRTRAAGLPVELHGRGRRAPAARRRRPDRLPARAGGARRRDRAGRRRPRARARPLPPGRRRGRDRRRRRRSTGPRTLVGVPERVGLYGGQLHAGRPEGGGHAVRARLPVGAGA